MNEHFEDEIRTPGYREWDAFELRTLLQREGFAARSGGFWIHSGRELALVVTAHGLFVGWLDVSWPEPSRPVERLTGCRHVPKGLEEPGLNEALKDLVKARLAAKMQCRYCGDLFDPGQITGRVCHGCAKQRGTKA